MNNTIEWTEISEADPRLPTDPKYVAVAALAKYYQVSTEVLVRLALNAPDTARTSEGNPWTENDAPATLFLHEDVVAEHFDKARK